MAVGQSKVFKMKKKVSVLAIIPARGGSKTIPKKNIKLFCKKPLIYWSIIQAKKSKRIDKVVVSSDSDEILSFAKKFHVETIKRPKKISGDNSQTEETLLHALNELEEKFDVSVLLQPTSPNRKPEDVDNALEYFNKKKLDSCFSGTLLEDFLIWKFSTKKKKFFSMNYNFKNRVMRQQREPEYVENGSIYIFKNNLLKTKKNRIGGKIGIYLMDFWQSLELDDPQDWILLQNIFKTYLSRYY